VRGQGSTRDGERLRVRDDVPLGQRLLGTGFSYGTDSRALQADGLTRLITRVRDIRRGGSCALDLCHVAEGAYDGYLEEGVNLWDYAAGALVAEEAGATYRVEPGRWGGLAMLAGPAEGFPELVRLVDEIGFFGE
jgi:myo-inositol-1(or 4)-monophosphatase